MQEKTIFDKVLNQFCIDNVEDEKISVEFEIKDIEKYNGHIITPDNITLPIKIVIDKKEIDNYKENNCQVYCTIYHELVHVLDYYNYCREFFDGNYQLMQSNKNFYTFYLWSEFNAKRKSYIYYRNLLQGNASKENQLNALINVEIPFINDNIDNEINNYNGGDLLYYIIHYLGRYMVWEEIYPEVINNYSYINKNVKMILDDKFKPLYRFLKMHKEMPSNIEEWNEFKSLINICNFNVTVYLAKKLELKN